MRGLYTVLLILITFTGCSFNEPIQTIDYEKVKPKESNIDKKPISKTKSNNSNWSFKGIMISRVYDPVLGYWHYVLKNSDNVVSFKSKRKILYLRDLVYALFDKEGNLLEIYKLEGNVISKKETEKSIKKIKKVKKTSISPPIEEKISFD